MHCGYLFFFTFFISCIFSTVSFAESAQKSSDLFPAIKPSRFNSCLFALPRKPRLNLGRRVGLGSLNINRSPDVRRYLANDRKIRVQESKLVDKNSICSWMLISKFATISAKTEMTTFSRTIDQKWQINVLINPANKNAISQPRKLRCVWKVMFRFPRNRLAAVPQ